MINDLVAKAGRAVGHAQSIEIILETMRDHENDARERERALNALEILCHELGHITESVENAITKMQREGDSQ